VESDRAPRELAPFVRAVRDRLDVKAVILFGSRARAEHLEDSDYDLGVVSDSFEGQNPYERRLPLYEVWYESGPLAPADLFALTEAELLAMDRLVVWDLLEEGIPLWDDGIWGRARREFTRRKREGRIIPVPGGWRVAEDA